MGESESVLSAFEYGSR